MRIPKNFNTVHIHEEELHELSIDIIKQHTNLCDHLELIYNSLDCFFLGVKHYQSRNIDDLSIQGLGIRVFNDVQSSLKLALSGYYQSAFMIVRDIIETGFLLDYFTLDISQVAIWRNCTPKERKNRFKAVSIRKALDTRDGYTQTRRAEIYSRLSEYANHPSFESLTLVSKDGLGNIGPFLDERYLKAYLEEVVKYLPYFSIVFLDLFDEYDETLIAKKLHYNQTLRQWMDKYM